MAQEIKRSHKNTSNQADFAQRLVKAVGFEDAIRECYENQWLGTLIHIQQMRNTHNI